MHSEREFEKILHFFPEKHVGRTILANVKDALVGTQDVNKYVAKFLMNYKIKGRSALDDLKETDRKQVKRDISPVMTSLTDALRDLKYVDAIRDSVTTEREPDWPKRGAGSTFLRTTPYPYVDGNYTINVAVDLMLTRHSMKDLNQISCEEKIIMAKDVTKHLL